jgi:hypothetical protein
MMTDRLALQHLTHCSTPIDHHLQAIPVTACSLVTAHLQATPMAAYSLTTAHLQAIPMTACSLVTHHLQAIPMTACSLVTAHLQENQMTGRLVWADRLMEKQTMDYLFQPHLLDRQRWLPRCATPTTDWKLSQMWPTGQNEDRPIHLA